jgi:hypothetical protein
VMGRVARCVGASRHIEVELALMGTELIAFALSQGIP